MIRNKFLGLGAITAVVIGVAVALSTHHSNQQADLGGSTVFADLKPALGDVGEIRFSKGDGSRTTLRKGADGWVVVERQYPADATRVRELALALANLKVLERKTSDPANYAKIGVENPDSPTAGSTLVEVVAGKKTWALIVGKSADGRAVYIRKPAEPASSLAQPLIAPDPDQKRWIDRRLTDIPGANVHDLAVKTGGSPPYLLTRAKRTDTDLTLSPVPKGRTPVSAMALGGQADALGAFNFDDVRPVPSPAAVPADVATYRTFDGQVIEFSGHREGEKAYITITTRRDPELAAQYTEKPATPATKPAAPADQTVEKLAARAKGVEFEIPTYKYEGIFKKQEDLLEKLPEPAKKAATKKK
ncbi:MAG TPA: DUF4340 domain-containing protein [Steroidobacteraceae bacterium]|jgi:hypothetical protein|nr:DUF4340 domain-containing protein [Steroidobacteraceae bacterium]